MLEALASVPVRLVTRPRFHRQVVFGILGMVSINLHVPRQNPVC
jgi:hypothetical protein